MPIKIVESCFDPHIELAEFQKLFKYGQYGATCSFIGTLRDFNNDEHIHSMFLEHYPGMTEKQLNKIAVSTKEKWNVLDVLIIHRVGQISIGETIVLTAACAAHREPAFAACRNLIERLKNEAPFWKKEQLGHTDRWVDKNSP